MQSIPSYTETEREHANEEEYDNDSDEEIDEKEDADISPPKKLGRKKNSFNGLIEWKANKKLVVKIPPHYILMLKQQAKTVSDRMQVMVTDV